jgi:hypothetical protein
MMRQGRIFAHLQSPQRHGYAAAGLHEHVLPPMPDVLGMGTSCRDLRDPHSAPGLKTRKRWPSGSSATKVRPKSSSVGGCAMASPLAAQSAWTASTSAAMNAISVPPQQRRP